MGNSSAWQTVTSAILAVLDFAEGDKPISTAGVTPDSTFDDQTAKYARVAFWIRIPIWASFPKKMLEDGTKMPIWQERGLNRAFLLQHNVSQIGSVQREESPRIAVAGDSFKHSAKAA